MGKLKLRSKDLENIGFPRKSKAIGLAINILNKHYKRINKTTALNILKRVVDFPDEFKTDPNWSTVVNDLYETEEETALIQEMTLLENAVAYEVFGRKNISSNAKQQMEVAMKLPITVGGALMPDAHYGYGLPIGGVLAAKNAVIPYAVGMDIGCRMCLSVFDISADFINRERYQLTEAIKEHTRFGEKVFDKPIMDTPVLDRKEFREIQFLKKFKDKAYKQLGSSGSGNHFVEFGIVEITEPDNDLQLVTKQYLGLLSHSGSRGLGANIASNYTKIARQKCFLPRQAQHLAWLGLDSEAGMEYWLAMNLAGDYASACHHQIHRRMAKVLGESPIAMVENHHNFAWKQRLENGQQVIVHRKGATPANLGELGIIPGSMTAPGFIVRGKGNPKSFNSASHGAGRAMSRSQAKNSFTGSQMRKELRKNSVKLIGGAIDESPMAYKDIHKVMAAQTDLVDILGTFTPKIVRMDRAK